MLSPDPVTQAPENGQNYNRYTYAYNNPLKYSDPSGFVTCEVACQFVVSSIVASVTDVFGFGGNGCDFTCKLRHAAMDWCRQVTECYLFAQTIREKTRKKSIVPIFLAATEGQDWSIDNGEVKVNTDIPGESAKRDSGGLWGFLVRYASNSREENRLIQELFFNEDSPIRLEAVVKNGNFSYGVNDDGEPIAKVSASAGLYSVSGTIGVDGSVTGVSVTFGGDVLKVAGVNLGVKVDLEQLAPFVADQFGEFVLNNDGLSGRAADAIRDRTRVLDEAEKRGIGAIR
jgi:hypothetical protein